jgi:hypothetical protein
MTTFTGTAGNDNIVGSDSGDIFKLAQGGDDIALGKAGNDEFRMGGALTAADSINGVAQDDTVILEGDYSFGLIFGATTILNIEKLNLKGAFAYDLTLDDGNIAADRSLTVDAGGLAAGFGLTFSAAAETNGKLTIIGSQSDDSLTGGAQGDKFILKNGGIEQANGNGGKDTFLMGDQLNASDAIAGGAGTDTVKISGTLTTSFTCNATTLTGIDRIVVTDDVGVSIVTHEATVASGETLEVDGSAVQANTFSFAGTLENDGHFDMIGGGAGGTLVGGELSDTLQSSAHTGLYTIIGGDGADQIGCNTGLDQVRVLITIDSSSTEHDTVTAFNAGQDRFDTSTTVTSLTSTSGSISNATFDGDLGTVIADSLAAGRAMVVTVTGGDLIGHSILVIDGNGDVSYTANFDYVIDITGFTGTLDTTDFI